MDYREYQELKHYGVLGMHWGHHKVEQLAKKDAQRYANAKMFYGKTAGTKRKLLKAELDNKKAKVPGYEEAFNKHLESVDYAKAAKKAVRTRTRKDVTYRTRVTTKQILGITGPITVAAAGYYYNTHREQVNAVIARTANTLVKTIKTHI